MTNWQYTLNLSTVARTPRPKVCWNVEQLTADMALRGWDVAEGARAAGLSYKTADRFLRGEVQTPKTAAKLAAALGYDVDRYLVRVEVPGKPPGSQGSPSTPIPPFEAAAVTR